MNFQLEKTKQVRFLVILAGIVLISLVLKIANEGTYSYWLDEGYTAWFANLSFHDIWFWLPDFESHPPLYYSLVKLWGLAVGGDGRLWHRGLSIFFSLLLVLSSYLSTRNVAHYLKAEISNAALFNSFLICFSPIMVWYSLEARPYILLSLAYSLAILGLIAIFSRREQKSFQGWVLFAIGTLLINWSHNLGGLYTGILFISIFVHWIVDRKFEKGFFLWMVACAIIVLALSVPLIIQIIEHLTYWGKSSWVAEPSLVSFVQILRRVFGFGFADKYMDSAFSDNTIIWATRIFIGLSVGVLSLVIACFGIYKLVRHKVYSLACFFVLSCFAFPLFSVLLSYFGPNILIERTLLPCLVPYFMLLSLSIEYIDRNFFRVAVKFFYIVILLLGLSAMLLAGKKEPWDEIMAEMLQETSENDVILLLPNDLYLPASLYATDPQLIARIESLPAKYPAIKYSDFYPDGFPAVPGIRPADSAHIQDIIAGKDRVFLITRQESLFDPDGVTRNLLSRDFDIAADESWKYIHIYKFVRK